MTALLALVREAMIDFQVAEDSRRGRVRADAPNNCHQIGLERRGG